MRRSVSAAASAAFLAATTIAVGMVATSPAHAVSGGTPVPDNTSQFIAKVTTEGRGCTAALVAPAWVITASSCFADTGLQAGPPPKPATVTLGATASSPGRVARIAYLAPRTDRNVTLALLDTPVTDVASVKLSTTAPSAGEAVTAAGYGRTTDTWVPNQARTAPFTVNATADTTATLAGVNGVDTCKGDAGGPTLRQVAGTVELVAVHSTSWQHGCLTVTETRQGSTEARIDNITDWIQQQTAISPIRNANGLCMDLGANDPGTKVIMASCLAGNPSQQWRSLPDGTIRNYNGLTMDIGSNADGTPVVIATAQPGNTSQQWTRADGTIRNHNGLCADLGSNDPDTRVIIKTCHSGYPSQQWSAGELTALSGKIRNHNGLCADLGTANPVVIAACQPAATRISQQWTAPIDGTIRNANGLCMDLGANDPGTKIVLASCQVGNPSQQWRPLPDGTIRNYNGLTMDIGSNADGTPILIATAQPGNTSQQWTIGA